MVVLTPLHIICHHVYILHVAPDNSTRRKPFSTELQEQFEARIAVKETPPDFRTNNV